ncbi:uncharacterized protein LOC117381165 isoform X6 [Periophthalmus magnuspinnatus]|uniref:uncharacterized protein LOC117381165 isoform X6 n=1 Tax=Periophthalmus magnuspinnatus TaxID=409849 RepID=UPI00145B99DE|nr:uncharacterized protein LOC117381165 isoform X6 [Periophthalmus magnuspinnatus]
MTDFVSSISNGLETMYNASTKSKKVFAIIILILLIYPTLELGVDSVTQQPPPPAPDQALPPAPLMKPVKVFLLITGQTYQAHQQILDKLNAQGSKVMITDAQQCDLILLFCPILSRVRSDVEAAFRKIPEDAQGKQVVLVQMHHTRKPEQVLNQIQWKEQFPIIIQDVQVLYHETQNGLLQCPRNERALHALQSMFAEFENKMATQRFFGKRSREKSSDLNTDSVSEDPVYKGALETMYNASTKSMAAFAIIILILLIDPTLDALETMYNAYTDFKKPFSIFILILLFYPTFHALETMYNASTKSKKVFPIIILILLIYPTLGALETMYNASTKSMAAFATLILILLIDLHSDALEKMYNASLKSKKVFAIIILTLLIYLTLGALETMYNASTKSMAAFAILILILLIDLHSDALEKMRNAYTEPTVLVAMFMLTLLSYRTLKGLKTIYNIYTKYMELFNINIKPLFKLQPSDALKKMPDASPKSMAAFAILILILFIHRTLKALKTIYNIFNKLLEAFILIILTLFIRLPLGANGRCLHYLRPVPVCEPGWDPAHASPRSRASLRLWHSNQIFPTRRARLPAPHERILRAVTCQADCVEDLLSPLRCPAGQRASAAECAKPMRIALLNARSIANKVFFLGDLFKEEGLDFMFLAETWQREQEYTHLNELCPPDCCVWDPACCPLWRRTSPHLPGLFLLQTYEAGPFQLI